MSDNPSIADLIAVVFKCKLCSVELPTKQKLISHIKKNHQKKHGDQVSDSEPQSCSAAESGLSDVNGYSTRGRKLRNPAWDHSYTYYGLNDQDPVDSFDEDTFNMRQDEQSSSDEAPVRPIRKRKSTIKMATPKSKKRRKKKDPEKNVSKSSDADDLAGVPIQNTLLVLGAAAAAKAKFDSPEADSAKVAEEVMQFSCSRCEMSFKRKSSLHSHYKKAHKLDMKMCSKCCMGFLTEDELQVHHHSHYENTFKCVMCDYCNSMWHKVKLHMQVHNKSNKFACDQCSMRFASASSLYSHKRFSHLGGSHLCDECGFHAPSKYSLVQHKMAEHANHFVCTICSFKCDNQLDLTKHMEKRHLQNFVCKWCPLVAEKLQFVTRELLFTHMAQAHPNEKCFVCDQCNYVAKLRHHLDKHNHMHTGMRPYKCKHEGCDFSTRDHRNLKQHLVTKHCKPGELVCRQCRFVTTNQNEWDIHKAMKHMKIFRCDQCDFKSSSSASVRRHRLGKHVAGDKMRFPCSQCSYVTNFRESLVKHALTHAIRETRFKCMICSTIIMGREAIKQHLATIHPEETVLLCPSCAYMTKKEKALEQHQATHTEAKPFSCKYCDYKGRTKVLLRSHMAHKHPMSTEALPPPRHSSRNKKAQLVSTSAPVSDAKISVTISTPRMSDLAAAILHLTPADPVLRTTSVQDSSTLPLASPDGEEESLMRETTRLDDVTSQRSEVATSPRLEANPSDDVTSRRTEVDTQTCVTLPASDDGPASPPVPLAESQEISSVDDKGNVLDPSVTNLALTSNAETSSAGPVAKVIVQTLPFLPTTTTAGF